ncbi:glycoside hydrolase family 9 protein [Amycolatopsis sp. 195334CR]|uniref:glycoside hydrolase family 9 protein n=1 Tax=Amycolatopsis sp. 195334CR TaxID=2814588 RepID=UPI001A8EDC9C|nr:glycoside hydrolase family 9 protein [Amycolatopsis sp. 195334CR]MBN6036686.1 glycoside hydrolase family 9 protein [Amycolatopsis sp. 195334CR]
MRRSALALLTVLLLSPAAPAIAAPAPGELRVDQVGYGPAETKIGYLLGKAPAEGTPFRVVDARGKTVHTGKTPAAAGAWNAAYPAVHQLDFSAVKKPGTYRLKVGEATSPEFRIDAGLFTPLARANNEFFQAQRDGEHVIPGRLNRKPAHLADRKATIYAAPEFGGDFGDEILAPLKPIGGPIDVEGGWADAGDYVKFTSNSAYSLAEMGYALRTRYDRALADEVRFGLRWLDKMWDARTGVLYAQVGIGTGSEKFGFLGDHDVWRLPEADDARQVEPGHPEYYVKHRPVFPANAPGEPVSPNLAGRVAAAFALGAQVERDKNLARKYLDEAASIFAKAKTTGVGELVTAFPHSYYPESSWRDDLELGATQLALAGQRLGDRRAKEWTEQAVHWAREYIGGDERGTLNLYDTSALAHADLARLAPHARGELVADLRRQLDEGVAGAKTSPFRTAVDLTQFDAATKSFGFAATARLYRGVTGDGAYDAFGTQQRNFALGANAWGISLVVGAGSRYPNCPHHQVANLAGSTEPGARILHGAVVNGPNGTANFDGLTPPDGATACSKPLAAFDTPDTRFFDDLSSWPSSEPAIDFTSTALLGFTLSP